MPFTFSHPAIVLPLKFMPKRWVSITGLIIGSMVPDFEYFIRMQVKSIYSHTWVGLFWFDLPLGLVLLFVYQLFVKEAVISHLPDFLNRRFSKFRGVDNQGAFFQYFIIAALSIFIGAVSHILWDGFTHPNGYFVELLPMLSYRLQFGNHPVVVYKAIQHTSTVVGAIVIIWAIYILPLGNPKRNHHVTRFWIQVILIAVAVLIIKLLTGLSYHQIGNVIVTAISGIFIGLFITSITSHLRLI